MCGVLSPDAGPPKQPEACGYSHRNRCVQAPKLDEAGSTERVFPRGLPCSNQPIDGRFQYERPIENSRLIEFGGCSLPGIALKRVINKPCILIPTTNVLLDISSKNKKRIYIGTQLTRCLVTVKLKQYSL